MNKIYKVIWSKVRNCYVAVSEIAKRNGKGTLRSEKTAAPGALFTGMASLTWLHKGLAAAAVAAWALEMATPAYALPVLDSKDAAVSIAKPDNVTMNIASGAANNVIKWVDFSIAGGANRETVNFDANNYLNYVTGSARSDIYGTLTGGGSIYIVNPNGVLFGDGAQVNVGSLYVSTRSLTDDQLSAFTTSGANPLTGGDIKGDVVNLGALNATDITVEGNNITFKNTADVMNADGSAVNTNVTLTANNGGEIHIGSADASTPAYAMSGTNKKYMYKLVSTADELQNMNSDLSGNYMLANSITLPEVGEGESNFTPVGSGYSEFNGKFDGLNYQIQNLTINSDAREVGLFGFVDYNGVVENVGLTGGSVKGTNSAACVGGVVGLNHGAIRNTYNRTAVTNAGDYGTGGIVGSNESGEVSRVFNTGAVSAEGKRCVGGIVGENEGSISNAYNTGTVSGKREIGGVVGDNSGGSISNVYNTGTVSGSSGSFEIGGIVGTNSGGSISNVYNTGTVSGSRDIGGIVGDNSVGSISNVYNTGTVSGSSVIGGIIGFHSYGATLSNGYSKTGVVTGGTDVSDTVGVSDGTVTNVAAVSEEALKKAETFHFGTEASGYGFENGLSKDGVWRIYEDNTMPLLTAFLIRKDYETGTTVYDGTNSAGATYTSPTTFNGVQEQLGGYNYVRDVSIVKPADLTVGFGASPDKAYDGTTDATAGTATLTGVLAGDTEAVGATGTAAFVDKNAGTDKIVNYTGVMLTGTKAANYNLTNAAAVTGTGTIEKADLTLTAENVTKTYDGTTAVVEADRMWKATSGTQLFGDDKASGGTFAFADKNAGTNKTVTVSGATISDGNSGNNYNVTYEANTTSTINPKALTVSFADISKTYDGTVDATAGAGTLEGVESVDDGKVDVTATATYDDKNAGSRTVNYTGVTLSGTEAANYSIAETATGIGTIEKKEIIVAFGPISKTYDGTVDATAGAGTLEGVESVDDGKVNVSASAAYDDKNAGDRTVNYTAITLTGDEAANYSIADTATGAGTITAKGITVSFADISKTYDGTTNATAGAGTLEGVESVDDGKVDVTASAAYDDKNAGDRTVNYTAITLTGDEAANYSIAGTATGIGTIEKKEISVAFGPISKTYDGTTNATAGAGTLEGVESVDDGKVNVSASAAYDDKNAGDRTVNYTGVTLSGTEAANYSIADTATGAGTITAKGITVSFADISKTYDGTTNATAGVGTLAGVETIDNGKVNVTATATYDEKNAGSRTVNYTAITLIGAEAANYSIAETATGAGTITAKGITVSFADISKTYDGTTNATAGAGTLSGVETIDSGKVNVTATATYDEKNAGSRTVNYTGVTLSGTEAANYSIADTATGAGTITAKGITVSFADISKTYDGTTNATAGAGTLAGVVADDEDKVSVSATATYDEKNAGDRTVNYTGVTLSGAEAVNYSIAETATGTGTITAKGITVSFADISKTYDGTTNATAGAGTLEGVESVDDGKVDVSASAAYDDKNAGSRTVNYTGVTLSGTEAANYSIAETSTGNGTINKADLTLTAEDVTKTYDGTTNVAAADGKLKISSGELYGNDSVSGGVFAFADKNAGTNKTVTVTEATISDGNSGGNYNVTYADNTTSTINPKVITAAFADISKTYNGTTDATAGAGTLSGVETIDSGKVNVSATATYDEKNVGSRTVNYTSVTLSGTEASNYSIADTATGAGTITAKGITVSFADISKTYDGTETATAGVGTLSGVETIDNGKVNVTATATYDEKNAGSRSVNYTGVMLSGDEAANYSIAETATGNGTINKADLTLTAEDVTKTYDGTTNVAAADGKLKVSAGELYGEDSVSGGTFAFTDKNAGTNKTVTVTGATITDGNSGGNYNVTYVDNTTSTINKADLTLTAENVTKTYDGTTNVAAADGKLKISAGELYGEDSVSGGTFAFTDKNAGTNKTVTVTGATITDGNSGNNYNVTYADNTTSTINKADLTLTAENVTKTYDGTTDVAATDGKLKVSSGELYGNDSVSGGTFAFTDKNAGSNKTVTVSGATISDGNSGGNYNVTYADNTTSTINKADLTLTAENVTKTYDGTTNVAAADGKLKVSSGELYGNDSVSGGTFAFTDKNAGTNKTVIVSNATISDGNSGGNYNVTYADNTTSTINKAALTLTAENVTKTYDGTTNVAAADGKLKISAGELYGNDSVSGGTFAFADKNAGTNKTVTVTGATISDGNSGGNYNVTYADNTASTINKANLTLTTENVTKTYDGTTNVAAADGKLKITAGELFGDDSVSGGAFAFADKNAGTNKTVTVTGATVTDGNSGNNYNVTYADNTTSTINKADLTLTAENVSKTYDGTTNVAVADGKLKVSSGELYGNDSVSGGAFAFADKNAGTNKTVTVSGATITDGNSGGNYNVTYADNTMSTINPKVITATFADISKTYDGTSTATAGVGTLAGVESVDDGKVDMTATATYDEKNAGSRTVNYTSVTLSGTEAANYSIAETATGNGTINKANLTLTAEDVTKTYDGTTNVAAVDGKLKIAAGELFGNDSVSGGTFAFTDKNAGTNKTVTVTGATITDGNSGNNYNVTYADNTTSTINPKVITATFADISKTYDGTATATAGVGTLAGVESVDDGKVDVSASAAYDDKNAGSRTVNYTGITLSGTEAANYSIAETATGAGTINKADLTLTAENVTKTYDGTTNVAAADGKLKVSSGELYGNDSVSGGTFAFADKNAGTNKTVTVTGAKITDGNSGGNYNVTYVDNTSSTITPKALTASFADISKTYDGTTDATAGIGTLAGIESVDDGKVDVTATATYDEKNAGSRTVNYTGVTLSGTEAANYSIAETATGAGTISQKALTATFANTDKVYDGTTTATAGTGTLSGVVADDDGKVSVSATATYDEKNAGSRTVNYTGVTLTGDEAANYSIAETATGAGTITAKGITVSFADISKTYDGTTNATAGVGTLSGVETIDSGKVNVTATATYDEKNAGSRTVNYTGVMLSGDEAANYSIAETATGAGTITAKGITVSFADISKTYDGTTNATAGVGTLAGVESVDDGKVDVTATATYGDKNAGSRTVNYTGVTLTGDEAANYSIAETATGAGTIDKREISVAFGTISKTYDGLTSSETIGERTFTDVIAADDGKVDVTATATYDEKNAGSRTVNYTGVTLTGDEAANYSIAETATGAGTITAKGITVSFADISKTYDGTTNATAGVGTLAGVESVDDGKVDVSATATYDEKNVGSRTVNYTSVTLSGTEAANYSIAETATGNGTINKANLTLTAENVTKTYDSTTNVAAGDGKLKVSAGELYGEDSVSGGTFAFADKNAGTNKTITVTGATISDGNSGGNYNVTYANNTTSTINKADLTLTAENVTKIYDGTTDVAAADGKLKISAGELYGNDSVSGGTFAFVDKNAGTNKTVTITGATITDGNSGNNYNVTYEDNTTSTINKADLTLTAENVTKTYDGTTNVAAADGKLKISAGELFGDDSVSGGAFAFADKNVGTNKTVTVSGATVSDGNSGGNYNVTYADNTNSTINKANLTLTAENVTKTYDGTTDVAAADGKLKITAGELYGNDSVSGGIFAFTDKNAGTNKTVTVSGATVTDGNSGNNYNVTYVDNTTSTINKADLALTAENVTKTYDGTTNVAAADGKLKISAGELYGNDSVSGGIFAFTDKNAGTNKTVTVSGATITDGNSGNNYNVTYADNTTSTINKADLTLTAENVTKTYDGTTNVAAADGKLKISAGELYGDDSVSGGTFAFADKNAGTNKTVTVTGATFTDGNSGGNYNVTYVDNTASTINKADLTLTAENVTKTYDGTTNVAAADGKLKISAGELFGEDSVSGGTFAFTDKNAGTNKTVTVSGATVTDGNSGGNYNVTYADNTTSTINKADLTLTAENVTKTYDGMTDVAAADGKLKISAGKLYGEDSVSGGAFAFADKNAGTNKTVTVTGATISDGNSGGNYNVTYADNTASTINKADLTLTAENVTKTYDGTTDVAAADGKLKISAGELYGNDSVSGGAFAFTDKNAGTNKTVTVTGATISDGNSGGNYNVTYADNTTSTITPKALTAAFADISKTYDGTTDATAGARTLSGVESVDDGKVDVTATATYDEKNAGSRTVNYTAITLTGAEAANYSIAATATGTGTISRKALELVADSVTIQEGDATPTSFTGSVTGFVAGESIGSSDTLLFTLADPSATAVGSYAIDGTLNGSASGDYGLNYTFSNAASNATAFTITEKSAAADYLIVSDIVPEAKGKNGGDIPIQALLNEQALAEDPLPDAERQMLSRELKGDDTVKLENNGMNQPPGMTPQEVAEQVNAQQGNSGAPVTEANSNAGANGNASASENGGSTLNVVMDAVQKTDNAIGTEESERKKGAKEDE